MGAYRATAWAPILGFGAVAVYVAFTVAAAALYPGSALPTDTFLSELGNADLSPNGWEIYNVGMILGGLLEIPFMVAVARHYSTYGRKRLVRTGLVFGLVNSVAVVLTGAVAEHIHMGVHIAWSLLVFVSFIPLLVAYSMLLWSLGGAKRLVGLCGYVVCGVDLGLLAALVYGGTDPGAGSLMEWIAVFAFLIWVVLLSYSILRGARTPDGPAKEPKA